MNFTFKKSQGFTLIETLVAISILLIAVAGPMVVVSQALTTSYYARDQITAFYLAQDAIEFLRNAKDKGMRESGVPFDETYTFCLTLCYIDTESGVVSPENEDRREPLNYLDGLYSYSGSGDNSRFSRSVKITPSDIDGVEDNLEQYRVDVTVEWKTNLNGVATRTITLTEYLYAVTSF